RDGRLPLRAMRHAYLGPAYDNSQIEKVLSTYKLRHTRLDDVAGATADLLADGKIVGWFQGRMEFGPRALGSRSILADPRDPEMQSKMNLKIKFRESFRPFAPAVVRERGADYFDLDAESPYMLLVAPVAEEHRVDAARDGAVGLDKLKVQRSTLPAITHVDHSAR